MWWLLLSVFLIVLAAAVLLGLALALVLWLPPVRRWGRRSPVAGMLSLYLLGGLSLAVSFAALTRGLAAVEYDVITLALTAEGGAVGPGMPSLEWQTQWRQAPAAAVTDELWLRLIRPPFLRRPVCYSGQSMPCWLVAQFATHEPSYLSLVNTEAWYSYGGVLAASLAAALANGWLAARLLRPARVTAEP